MVEDKYNVDLGVKSDAELGKKMKKQGFSALARILKIS